MPDAETYAKRLESLIKDAAVFGYDLYVEVDGSVEIDRYNERFELSSVGLTFSNQEKVKKFGGRMEYASADESLYFTGMA